MPRPDYIWEKPHMPPEWQIAREPERLQWYRWRLIVQALHMKDYLEEIEAKARRMHMLSESGSS
eukprot:6604815-Karenia_brevis.AAC.1